MKKNSEKLKNTRTKRVSRNKKHFSFLKDFTLPEIVSDLRVHLQTLSNSFSSFRNFELLSPSGNVQLIVLINENACLKTYFTSDKGFNNHFMYNK